MWRSVSGNDQAPPIAANVPRTGRRVVRSGTKPCCRVVRQTASAPASSAAPALPTGSAPPTFTVSRIDTTVRIGATRPVPVRIAAPASRAARIPLASIVASPEPAISGFLSSRPAAVTVRSGTRERLLEQRDVGGEDAVTEPLVGAEAAEGDAGTLGGGGDLVDARAGPLGVEAGVDAEVGHADEDDVRSRREDRVERVLRLHRLDLS